MASTAVQLLFRFCMYGMFGLCLEILFSVFGIERALGYRLERRVPARYLEGFVSLTMIPLHGLGILFLLEPLSDLMQEWFILFRYAAYAVGVTAAEAGYGWLCEKALGFYSWDYYARSKYRVFPRGYTLWTLLPLWGLAGLILEPYIRLMRFLSPYVATYVLG
jgi:hypothetical protein